MTTRKKKGANLPATTEKRIGELAKVFHSIEPVTIVDEESRSRAAEQFAMLTKVADELEELFSPAVAAAKDAYDAIRAARDEYLVPLRRTERTVRDRIGAWATKQLEAAAPPPSEMLAEDDVFAAAIGGGGVPAVPTKAAPVVDDNVGLSTRHEWELVDVRLIRPEYLEPPTPNRKAIGALVKAMGTGSEAAVSIDATRPGIRVRKVMVAVRK